MEKLLIVGTSRDATYRYASERLRQYVKQVESLNIDDFVHSERREFVFEKNFARISYDDREIIVDQDFAILNRSWNSPYPEEELARRSFEFVAHLHAFLDVTDILVLNRPASTWMNSSKPLQMRHMRDHKLPVPHYVASRSAAFVFNRIKLGRWISKGASGTRTKAEAVNGSEFAQMAKLNVSPAVFQRRVDGFEVRCHSIGREVVCARIVSRGVDYRYARSSGRDRVIESFPTSELGTELIVNLQRYCRKVGLLFAGIDLIYDKQSGAWFVLEVNPAPGFEFFDRFIDEGISKALARFVVTDRLGNIDTEISEISEEWGSTFIRKDRRPFVQY